MFFPQSNLCTCGMFVFYYVDGSCKCNRNFARAIRAAGNIRPALVYSKETLLEVRYSVTQWPDAVLLFFFFLLLFCLRTSQMQSDLFLSFPLCCSVNSQWDDGACGALFSEDRYALMHQRLQVLLKMSAYAHTHIQSRV